MPLAPGSRMPGASSSLAPRRVRRGIMSLLAWRPGPGVVDFAGAGATAAAAQAWPRGNLGVGWGGREPTLGSGGIAGWTEPG